MVFKYYARKVRYAKKIKENEYPPIWVILRKYGRLVSPLYMKVKRNWRYSNISL
ncbi:hypothetical protein BA065_02625 [Nanoarchaeota archaeon NZ13-N]|nr:MAG: hypothetical protein BA065_02625 [Nanoarchaeota archaeon NZ13-N]